MIKQQGSVLLISLGVLVVLTLMSFGLSNSILLQERLTADTRSDSLALEVVESALIDAEEFLLGIEVDAFTAAGNEGLYKGDKNCAALGSECYALSELPSVDLFSTELWTDNNSRVATTAIPCPHGDVCPLPDEYKKGRFKAIYLGKISSGESIRVITSQLQDANDTYLSDDMALFKIIATGTSANEDNRRVLISYFVAPVLE